MSTTSDKGHIKFLLRNLTSVKSSHGEQLITVSKQFFPTSQKSVTSCNTLGQPFLFPPSITFGTMALLHKLAKGEENRRFQHLTTSGNAASIQFMSCLTVSLVLSRSTDPWKSFFSQSLSMLGYCSIFGFEFDMMILIISRNVITSRNLFMVTYQKQSN